MTPEDEAHRRSPDFLHVYRQVSFLETQGRFDASRVAVLGAPLDLTGTFRQGYRFGPDSIRTASSGLEYYSPRAGRELSGLTIVDIGNVELSMDVSVALAQIRETLKEVISSDKRVLVLGGEHTVGLACFQACEPDFAVVFDAHLDCRDTYKDLGVSHATWLRRATEGRDRPKVVHVGSRAFAGEEVCYAKDRIITVRALDLIRDKGAGTAEMLKQRGKCWISVDMDVFDPCFAPAVGNPEPEGLSPTLVFDMLHQLLADDIVGYDICEVVPHYDRGQTSLLAGKLAIEMLAHLVEQR